MKIRRDMIFAVLTTFCLSALMFAVIPIRGGDFPYDPWADYNDDGKIDIRDIAYVARMFGTSGTAINKTEMKRAIELQQLLEHILNKNYTDWYNGLVGYWKLDEGAGNMTLDSSGNGNNGTLINDPTWVDGKYGKALWFNGSNYVMVSDSQNLRVQNFTLEAWVYLTKRPYEYGRSWSFPIISKFGGGPEGDYWGYDLMFNYPTSTNDNLAVLIGRGQGYTPLLQYNSIDDLTLDQWHQIVATFNGHTATLYIDGIPRISNTYSETPEIVYVDNTELKLGKSGVWYCTITIDQIMIYSRNLSAEEVMLHYLIPPP